MRPDINHELNILRTSFENAIRPLWSKSIPYITDNSFRPNNWLITFPYNFESSFKDESPELIRKLALINAVYLVFFLREDDVLDEYHLPHEQYRELLLKMCNAHSMRNLAVGQLLHLCGTDVYSYLFDYERKYYNALILEKNQNSITVETMLDEENLCCLGWKLMPLALTYAGFCIKTAVLDNIKSCENLILHYHIAKQMSDDINDLDKDLYKPDKSYLIRACEQSLQCTDLTVTVIKDTLIARGFDKKILATIGQHLDKAKKCALELDFRFFLEHIDKAEQNIRATAQLWLNKPS
ncbi:MAG: hypothetical protein KKB77_08220 [Bacteroidetes bacterium]|nr:hypothetical protein [Bacteroidota bacterium]